MQLPEFLKKFQKDAEKLVADHLVDQIEFSGGTYQAHLAIPGTTEPWVFLQLDNRGQLKDCFCSQEEEETRGCVHLAAAVLAIYNSHLLPLHQRFEKSLWNQLCKLYTDRIGDDPDLLEPKGRSQYVHHSVGGKEIFSIKATGKQAVADLKNILFYRPKETEETSLKFSNLSPEEMALWKEGHPTLQLRYELSFWYELARWMMRLEEQKRDYEISFEYSAQKIPNLIQIRFPEIQCRFYLSEANLPLIIPALSHVKSPLIVHNAPEDSIACIRYDRVEQALIIIPKSTARNEREKKGKQSPNGYSIGNWLFVPGDGFYLHQPEGLLAQSHVRGNDISRLLNESFAIVRDLVEGVAIHREHVTVSYTLDFDASWNLHIICYLFSPGDLTSRDSAFFGEWAYLKDDGFYHLEGLRFPEAKTVVPAHEIADFINHHRGWLNTQNGFQTHLASIESELSYVVTAEQRLVFSSKESVKEDTRESKDFGPWVYIPGGGFYAKTSISPTSPVRPGINLSRDQVPLFIRMNRDELQLIRGFFSEHCPVVKSGIEVTLDSQDVIHLNPQYTLRDDYKEKDVRFFDDFAFVEGEGFHELPIDSRLPERFRHQMTIERDNLPLFLTYELAHIDQYIAALDPRLQKPHSLTLTAAKVSKADDVGKGWYRLKLSYNSDQGSILITDLCELIKKKQRFAFSAAGLIDIEEKRFDWLRHLAKSRIDKKKHTIILSTLELFRLNAFDEIYIPEGRSKEVIESREILSELIELRVIQEPNPELLTSELRPYQQLGLRWLWFLYQHGLSGLLCDDMGLGKTHQAMALIASVMREKSKERPPRFLIVCPTSVVFHWEEKLLNFLPEAAVCRYYGSGRQLPDLDADYDVLLTSYGIWRIDNEALSSIPFEIAIFDELQLAKNHNSRLHAALLEVDAKMRVGLTGTPLENHLRELKALFDLTLPGYMPGDTDYRELFVKPIERDHDLKKRHLLSRFVKPFILRRKKGDVLLDLPEKTEQISHCALSLQQRKYYKEVLERSRQSVLEKLANSDEPIPFIHIFAILSSLKQICNHPAAFLKQPENYREFESGKWDLFVELFNEARESEQKVVVFSQYLTMLDILENYLNDIGVGFASIRGATQNRGEQVKRFNGDPSCKVFLASLQAAGLGIDLTAGSVVIHYDRWWNAARENQATDRVHRIGQKRGVQVFKLVTKGTFEDRIDELITKKGKLMEDVVGVDDHQILKQFDRKELIELLQYIEEPEQEEPSIPDEL